MSRTKKKSRRKKKNPLSPFRFSRKSKSVCPAAPDSQWALRTYSPFKSSASIFLGFDPINSAKKGVNTSLQFLSSQLLSLPGSPILNSLNFIKIYIWFLLLQGYEICRSLQTKISCSLFNTALLACEL